MARPPPAEAGEAAAAPPAGAGGPAGRTFFLLEAGTTTSAALAEPRVGLLVASCLGAETSDCATGAAACTTGLRSSSCGCSITCGGGRNHPIDHEPNDEAGDDRRAGGEHRRERIVRDCMFLRRRGLQLENGCARTLADPFRQGFGVFTLAESFERSLGFRVRPRHGDLQGRGFFPG